LKRDEKAHDSTEFSAGSWLENRLVLFDQAYFKYRRFALIDENDDSFVSRLKPNANPEVTAELREWRRHAIPLEGKKIQDVVDNLQRKYIDVEVEATFQRREYVGTQSWDSKRFRVVGVRDEDADDYHLYITNLPREEFLPSDLATLVITEDAVFRTISSHSAYFSVDIPPDGVLCWSSSVRRKQRYSVVVVSHVVTVFLNVGRQHIRYFFRERNVSLRILGVFQWCIRLRSVANP
jgi:hypothetical protein